MRAAGCNGVTAVLVCYERFEGMVVTSTKSACVACKEGPCPLKFHSFIVKQVRTAGGGARLLSGDVRLCDDITVALLACDAEQVPGVPHAAA